ncbi:MAG: hypothetical protein AAF413_04215 [Patescibacteria group bacterium]
MTLTNHMLTGAIIGATVSSYWIAAPAALLSHIVLDVMPHYGFEGARERLRKTFTSFWFVMVFDAAFVALLLSLLAFTGRVELIVFAVIAASPDFIWIHMFRTGRFEDKPYRNLVLKFLKNIQQFESPKAIVVDIVYGIAAAYVLYSVV